MPVSEKVLYGRGIDSCQHPREGRERRLETSYETAPVTHEAAPHPSAVPLPLSLPQTPGCDLCPRAPAGRGCGRKGAESNFLIQVEDVPAVPGKTLLAAVHFNLETGPDQQPSGPASRIVFSKGSETSDLPSNSPFSSQQTPSTARTAWHSAGKNELEACNFQA